MGFSVNLQIDKYSGFLYNEIQHFTKDKNADHLVA